MFIFVPNHYHSANIISLVPCLHTLAFCHTRENKLGSGDWKRGSNNWACLYLQHDCGMEIGSRVDRSSPSTASDINSSGR